MFQQVAMEHSFACKVGKWHQDLHRFLRADIHYILPNGLRLWLAIAGVDLKGIDMEMKRMIHVGVVDQFPQFHSAEFGAYIDAIAIELLPIKREGHHSCHPGRLVLHARRYFSHLLREVESAGLHCIF